VAVLELELTAFTLIHFTSLFFFVMDIFEIGSCELLLRLRTVILLISAS
jgi:hypothetical protein